MSRDAAWVLLLGFAVALHLIAAVAAAGWVDDPAYLHHDLPPGPSGLGECAP